MTFKTKSSILAFVRGLIAGVAMLGTILLGLQSASAVRHMVGHITGIVVVEISMGR
jgi:hypothetical protein